MILDASAVVAIVFQEPGYHELLQKIAAADTIGIGAPTLAECAIVVSARLDQDARGLLARFLEEADVTIIPFTDAHYGRAVGAWRRYGKGRHVAGLNFGDCLAYAVAQLAGMPLLCADADFAHTELPLA